MTSQIKHFRKKQILNRRRSRRVSSEPDATAVLDMASEELARPELEQGESSLVIVRHKRFTVYPMTEEEAIEQMELLGHDCFVFCNPADDQMNVRYRRKDGHYGLIQPALG